MFIPSRGELEQRELELGNRVAVRCAAWIPRPVAGMKTSKVWLWRLPANFSSARSPQVGFQNTLGTGRRANRQTLTLGPHPGGQVCNISPASEEQSDASDQVKKVDELPDFHGRTSR